MKKTLLFILAATCSLASTSQNRTEYKIYEPQNNNPAIRNFHADPEILYSAKDKKYYIYATTDGYDGWGGYYFKCFSSKNLKNWKDEGTILDLRSDVEWCNEYAWAPCIVERKEGDGYKYYFYYTGKQQIGLAISDNPTRGFKDIGRPLINQMVTNGQNIDPDVFQDPQSGKYYIYWGNMFLAVAELAEDMKSIVPGTTKVITPKCGTYREGAYVIYRKGKYYVMWSEDDTRSENYRVRYGFMSSPTSEIEIPENNLILAKDTDKGIYGTGHNSAICKEGRDEWYIVYHRFNRPNGITMGDPAGFHREVCIDRMYFDKDGKIIPVKPTLEGVR